MKKAVFLLALFALTACAGNLSQDETPRLRPVSFAELAGWNEDAPEGAIKAFVKSCGALQKKKDDAVFVLPEAGKAKDWKNLCRKAAALQETQQEEARAFFESNFQPFAIQNEGPNLFTGYYEPLLNGSLVKKKKYKTPLLCKPKDMIVAELGIFKAELKGQKVTGKVKEQKLVPYDSRAQIVKTGLKGRARPLVWVDDPVDAFFLEIQGSGRVRLGHNKELRVGFAGQNGREYVPIGRILAARGDIEKPINMQKIREWMRANPQKAQQIMNENPSYVFFRKIEGDGPIGAQGVPLTPMRSMAVDTRFIPLGAPLWADTEKHKRLVIAQDTGGAIKGAVRGDLFWGHGAEAAEGAGNMQESGTYYILLPKEVGAP